MDQQRAEDLMKLTDELLLEFGEDRRSTIQASEMGVTVTADTRFQIQSVEIEGYKLEDPERAKLEEALVTSVNKVLRNAMEHNGKRLRELMAK